MPARLIGKKAMTSAQRQKRYRERKKPDSTVSKQLRRAAREKTLAAATLQASAALGSARFQLRYCRFGPPDRSSTAPNRPWWACCRAAPKAPDCDVRKFPRLHRRYARPAPRRAL
jgi:hypothetical protein